MEQCQAGRLVALSQPIDIAIVGCSTPDHVRTLARVGRDFSPLSPQESAHLMDVFHPHAKRLAFYRGTL